MRRVTQPLFDAGWLFVIAGMTLCAAIILVPAQRDLHRLQQDRDRMRHDEITSYARLEAHAEFLTELEEHAPALIRRLAASQLNIVPGGKTPVLVRSSATASVFEWIESSVEPSTLEHSEHPPTLLARLAEGPKRHWLLAVGGLCVFIGLMLSPSGPRAWRSARTSEPAAAARSTTAQVSPPDRVRWASRPPYDPGLSEAATSSSSTSSPDRPEPPRAALDRSFARVCEGDDPASGVAVGGQGDGFEIEIPLIETLATSPPAPRPVRDDESADISTERVPDDAAPGVSVVVSRSASRCAVSPTPSISAREVEPSLFEALERDD